MGIENKVYLNTVNLHATLDQLQNQDLKKLVESLNVIRDSVEPKLNEFAGEHATSYFELVKSGYFQIERAIVDFSMNYTKKATEDVERAEATMKKASNSAQELTDDLIIRK